MKVWLFIFALWLAAPHARAKLLRVDGERAQVGIAVEPIVRPRDVEGCSPLTQRIALSSLESRSLIDRFEERGCLHLPQQIPSPEAFRVEKLACSNGLAASWSSLCESIGTLEFNTDLMAEPPIEQGVRSVDLGSHRVDLSRISLQPAQTLLRCVLW